SAPAPQATFFGDFLFCQKRKSPPAGKALTPQNTEETNQSQRTEKQQPLNALLKQLSRRVISSMTRKRRKRRARP
ncbi:hypothetical protein, partial [Polaromonas sp.]|uniref:hypothetical protein n=1 Tax=Polaromonas sp. TaxID=1869339 RepID=UPI0025FBE321